MRRKVLIGALALLALVVVFIVSVVIYIRSGRLDQVLRDEILETLDEAGIRAEIGGVHVDLAGYKVTLTDLKLFDKRRMRPLGSVERLVANFSVISYLRQEIKIDKVEVVAPEIWIERNKRGRSNLDSLQRPREKREDKDQIEFLDALITVSGGKVHYNDRQHEVAAELQNLSITFAPRDAASGDLDHTLQLAFDDSTVSYQGRPVHKVKSLIESTITEELVEFSKIELSSDAGSLGASGKLSPPSKYEFDIRTDVVAEELARVLAPSSRARGRVVFDGQVEGQRADYRITGQIASDALVADGYQLSGLRINTDLSVNDDQYQGTTQARSNSISGSNFSANQLIVGGRIAGRGLDLNLTGQLSLGSAGSAGVLLQNLQSRIEADRDRVSLAGLQAALLGGSVSGSASLAYSGAESKVDLAFKSIDIARLAELASPKDVTVTGALNGEAHLSFGGLNYQNARGTVDASFEANVATARGQDPGGDTVPVTPGPAKGDIRLAATGNGFRIERAVIASASSEAVISGTVGWNGHGALSVNFSSDDMSEVYRAFDALGLISERLKRELEPSLGGAGQFNGTLEGDLSAPTVSGQVQVEKIEMHGESLGRFQANVFYSPTTLRLENASLVASEGSRADFTLEDPSAAENDMVLRAKLVNFDLPAVIRAVIPGLGDTIQRGTMSGEIALSGLPGPRTIAGSAEVSLSGAELNLSAVEGEEAQRSSISELTGKVTIADNLLSIENVRVQLADSSITGTGTIDLDTYAFNITAEGKNIDLGNVSEAFSDTTGLGGQADVNIVGRGEWDQWSNLDLNATIQGRNVTLRGRPLGDAKLTAVSQDGTLRLRATGQLEGEPHELTASINLREGTNYPITAEVDFTDTELSPYLKLISPQLGDIAGIASGRISLTGPLADTDKITATAVLTKLEIGGKVVEGRNYKITNQGDVVIRATPREITVEKVSFVGEGTSITVAGSLARGDDSSITPRSTASSLSVTGDVNLRLVSSFTEAVQTAGVAQVQAAIGGTLEQPSITGFVDLKDVGLRVPGFPVAMTAGVGQIRFTSDQARIENFTAATPGGGHVTLAGGAALAGLIPDQWRLEVTGDEIRAEFPTDAFTTFDGNFVLQGNRRFQVLSGDVRVRRSSYTKELTIAELLTTGGPFGSDFVDTGGGGGGGMPITLDLNVTADNNLVVRNNLADALGSAHLDIRGTAESPLVSGRVTLTRGTFEFRNDRYELTRGSIIFPGTRHGDPIVDFQLEREISGYRVSIGFNGPLANLRTTLGSDPELSDADVLALVLEGHLSEDRATPAATNQTGLGLARTILSASISEQLELRTQRLFGLGRLSIDPLIVGRSGDFAPRVTFSRRIAEDLTITYSQNLTSGPSELDRIVLVEYRLSNRFSLVGIRDDKGAIGFDIRIRKRF